MGRSASPQVPKPLETSVSFVSLDGRPVDSRSASNLAAKIDLNADQTVYLRRDRKTGILFLQTENCIDDAPPTVRPVTDAEAFRFFNRAGFKASAKLAFPQENTNR